MQKLNQFRLGLALLLAVPAALASGPQLDAPPPQAREWIENMKQSERGPFERIRWFCNDGTVQPPRAYACSDHGGGYQHGEWNQQAVELRANGFMVATVLAGLDAAAWVSADNFRQLYAQVLIEKFLVAADDGWIFRKALYYRGALQEEDEREAARRLLTEMAGREQWIGPGYPALRAGVRLLPHGANTPSVQKVRQVSAALSDKDNGFKPLRAKIHGSPGAEDAAAVRDYAAGLAASERQPYLDLADEIDRIYQPSPLDSTLRELAARYTAAPWLQTLLTTHADQWRDAPDDVSRFRTSAQLLADLRTHLGRVNSWQVRLQLLDLSLRVEGENFRLASRLRERLPQATRSQRLDFLGQAALAAYGTGVLNARLLSEMQRELELMQQTPTLLNDYRDGLDYLSRAPGWGTQTLRMYFFEEMTRLAQIEPLAMLFIQDQLRGSPLLIYSKVLDGLGRDGNRLAGVKHRLFDETVGVGFTALNPGLARGTLYVEPDLSEMEHFRPDGIYLLPETVSDLPPVAGVLTAGEGNPLSPVQLLARNLGIPNVTVGESVLDQLKVHNGERVVLAVSPSGLVEISPWSEKWQGIFREAEEQSHVLIQPDLEKLDLSVRRLITLDELRAEDSGRIVGPKAAKLGELRSHYPDQVSRGVAIPFGIFRHEILDQPYSGGQGSVFDWMVREYRRLEQMEAGSDAHAEAAETFRAELYGIILNTRPSDDFRNQLKRSLVAAFGKDELPGVFVRSDTNVEDLAGFTGAGLNLTMPNVVGWENLLNAISQVWASPFTARAFAWRQSHMNQPEHVYTSILLLESVPSDKSGVLVTQDIDDGDRETLSVAVNEGLGGAVDGQAAESLRIPMDGSHVRVLATATAPERRVPAPAGGLLFLPSSGSDTVLQPEEISQLIGFARELPQTFPAITDDQGQPAPADVEFGFLDGQLRLFQIRPFLESQAAQGIDYLHEMESRHRDTTGVKVDLDGVPQS